MQHQGCCCHCHCHCACACGYDDCPSCNPSQRFGLNRCDLHQSKEWNGHPILTMSQEHLQNTMAWLERQHGSAVAKRTLVYKRMAQVLRAKQQLGIDHTGFPRDSCIRV